MREAGRPSRRRHNATAAEQDGSRGARGGGGCDLSAGRLAIGVLCVCAICGAQFLMLARPTEPLQGNADVVSRDLEQAMADFRAERAAMTRKQEELERMLQKVLQESQAQQQRLLALEGKLLQASGGGLPAPLPPFAAAEQAAAAALGAGARPPGKLPNLRGAGHPLGAAPLLQAAAQPPATIPPSLARLGSRPPGGAAASGPRARPGDFPTEWLAEFGQSALEASAAEAIKWRDGTKAAFLHVWDNYHDNAWGKDELRPVTGTEGKKWANCGLQILDALSTMWVMGLHSEFDEAARWVEHSLTFDNPGLVSFFELTIRGLGGLISAHSLSGREIFLKRAVELADKMLPAFKEDTGFPMTQVNLRTGAGAPGWYKGTVLAEAGTVQLEFRYLSQQTGDPKYAARADKAMRNILVMAQGRGLVPWGISQTAPLRFTNTHVTFGAMGDSYYEYLLKMHLQTGQTEAEWRDPWLRAMLEMHQRLILHTPGGLTYLSEEQNGRPNHKMDHLACYVGGMLIYGTRKLEVAEVDEALAKKWEETAAGITETCYQMYHRQPSHLAPECSEFRRTVGGVQDMAVWNNAYHYLLRPEAAEAIFYMFYYTGDPKYRRMAGEIFEAIQEHTKTTYGYSAVRDVRKQKPVLKNEMETFFLAETLKYLYLTFVTNPRDVVDLDEFVFTTEAHPIRIFRPRNTTQVHIA